MILTAFDCSLEYLKIIISAAIVWFLNKLSCIEESAPFSLVLKSLKKLRLPRKLWSFALWGMNCCT